MALPTRDDRVPILHDYLAFRRDPVEFWVKTGELGPAVEARLGPAQRFVVITDPEIAEHILLKAVKDHPRDRRVMSINDDGGPERMFTTDRWEEWKWRRRLMQPAFHRQSIAEFGAVMTRQAARLADEIMGTAIDVASAMRLLTMRIILETMFSVTDETDVHRLQDAFESSSEYVFERASSPFPLPSWVPTPTVRAQRRNEAERMGFLTDIVDRRLADGPGEGDLLDMLIAARLDDSEHSFSAEQLVAEMSGIVFAGHETTAVTLTWLLWELARHPDVETAIRSEITEAIGDRVPEPDDLEAMPLVDQTIQETMRLYPPVYVTVREADVGGQVGGLSYGAGDRFILNIRGLHLDPDVWDQPDRFMPERFAADTQRHRFQYIPFLGGPKKCLGDSFAMMEMRLVVPVLLQQLTFTAASTDEVRAQAGFTLKPSTEVRMQAEARA